MKVKYLYLSLGLASLFYLGFSRVSNDPETSRNKSIIKFSHSLHAEMSECGDCHSAVSESEDLSGSLLPGKDDCAGCHDVDDDDNCELCHYEDLYEPLIPSQSELIFNHKFHISDQNMECENCHLGLTEVEYSYESENANPTMTLCYDCHNNNTIASNACEQCHISTANLLPDNHKKVGFFKSHKFVEQSDCQLCHDAVFCEDCHVATTGIDETNLSNDFYTPYAPHNYVDGDKQQVITLVHDLNYRFTHGIEAKGKTNDCQTCHQTETFCVECHAAEEGDFALGGIIPLSHTMPNFVNGLTPGSDHAVLAKRDIERCASCHDVQGADPNCILCHVDPDGIKGTNPKTHSSGFMKSVNGDWHDDGGSVCYDCHTNTNTAGLGFCGYCHGAD